MQPHVEFLFQEWCENFFVVVNDLRAKIVTLGSNFLSFTSSCWSDELVHLIFSLELRSLLWDRRIDCKLHRHLVIVRENSHGFFIANY